MSRFITEIVLKAESTNGIITPTETLDLVANIRDTAAAMSTIRTELNKAIADKDITPTLRPWLKYVLALAS